MKRFRKKALALLLTAAMIVGLAPAAFAGTFSDVSASASYAGAVDRLAGLGVVQGMGDGTYAPAGTFTRAQAAAIVVRMLGLDAAAAGSKGSTNFSDVAADHWATGYINVASSQGIVQGMGDGTFAPDGVVTQAQFLTMLVRALGYEPTLVGSWPMNIMTKAAELGLSKGVTIVGNLPAARSEVAVMANNAIDTKIMEQTSYGSQTKYEVSATKTLLNSRLADNTNSQATATQITAVPRTDSALKAGQIKANTKTYDTTGVDIDSLLGVSAKIWANADMKALSIEQSTKADRILSGFLDDTFAGTDGGKTASTWSIQGLDKDYAEATTTRVRNNVGGAATGAFAQGDYVRIILDDQDKVAYMDGFRPNNVVVITKVDTANKVIDGVDLITSAKVTSIGFDTNAKTSGGKALAVGDVKVGDVAAALVTDGKITYGVIDGGSKVTGTLESSSADGKGNVAITVGGNALATAMDREGSNTFSFTVKSENNGSAVSNVTTAAGLSALAGKSVTAYTWKGKAGYVVGDASGSSSEFRAVIIDRNIAVETADGTKNYMRVMKSDGTVVSYQKVTGTSATTYKKDGASSTDAAANYQARWIVKIVLNSDGTLKSVDSISTGFTSATMSTTASMDKDNSRITVGGTVFRVNADTKIYDLSSSSGTGDSGSEITNANEKVLTWDVFKAIDPNGTNLVVDVHPDADNANVAKEVVIKNTAALSVSQSAKYGVVKAVEYVTDGTKVTMITDSGTASYIVDSGGTPALGAVVSYQLNQAGTKATFTTQSAANGSGSNITSVDTNNNTLVAGSVYFSDAKTVYVDAVSGVNSTTMGALLNGWTVKVYNTSTTSNGDTLEFVVVTAKPS